MIALETAPRIAVPEVTLFAFDEPALPWRDNLQLAMATAEKHPANPVLRAGPPGAPDATHALIYGSVLEIERRFRCWYLGMFEPTWDHRTTGWWRPMCYAESDDGVHWRKPELGLVEFEGSRANNICLIEPEDSPLSRVNDFLSVMHDPVDPDPARRFKAAFIAHVPWEEARGGVRDVGMHESRVCAMVCATSPDGLRWRVVGDRPMVNEKFEVSGLYRFGEFYHAAGQQITPWCWLPDGRSCGRAMTVYRSADFKRWSSPKALGFARPGQLAEPPVPGQQTHMGAGIWPRGNVLVGLYGMWQDGPAERPAGASGLWGTRVDLGLIVSDNGVTWREPAPGHAVIARGEEGDWDGIALTQGHAFANVGEQTYVWYAHWDCEWVGRPQEIGLATLRRDGFGALVTRHAGHAGHVVSCLVQPGASRARVFANVEGVSEDGPVRVELLDARDRPLAGYSGEQAAIVSASGVRVPAVWPAGDLAPASPFAIRAALPAGGAAKLYALYVTEQ